MNMIVAPDRLKAARSGRAPLTVALVNNMPDGALAATERQFRHLIETASDGMPVRIEMFHIPEILRGEAGRRFCAARARPIQALFEGAADALIVTGCEPRAERLTEEPYWDALADLVDWAAWNTRSSLWSCLAAHAAVLHLDGIERRRLPRKASGVFACAVLDRHALFEGCGDTLQVPHSRRNTLEESDLVGRGYTILTRSETVGVDCFVKDVPSRFVFLQGHPEYDPETLGREYERDRQRFRSGELSRQPNPPENYQIDDSTAVESPKAGQAGCRAYPVWGPAAVTLARNWLALVNGQTTAPTVAREVPPPKPSVSVPLTGIG